MAEATLYFPADFLWGTATSSHQVEGQNQNNDWWAWEAQEGKILEGHRSGRACDWWDNAEADHDRAAQMGTNAHRLSLEWSRIEPEPSVFSGEALARYREILQAMHQRGIEPIVTLHHFTNPLWLTEKGDFDSDIVVDYFRRYTAKVVSTLGDLVDKWVTINEPMIYVLKRYLENAFPPPAARGWSAAGRALQHLLRCHAAAYHTIKDVYPAAQVGVAKNMAVLEARPGGNTLDKWWAGQLSFLFNDWWMLALRDGYLRWPLAGGHMQNLARTSDFVGINYYARYYTRFLRTYEQEWPAGATVGDGNYGEVYPYGLYRVIRHALRYEQPIYITENGVPDMEDKLRPAFLLAHLRELWRTVNFNWPVMGYFHWSLVDNFEWEHGWTQRFGLIAMNPETGERRLRRSGQLYSEICNSGSISSDMVARYAPQLMSNLFPGSTGDLVPAGTPISSAS